MTKMIYGSRRHISAEQVRDCLDYNHETGVFVWKKWNGGKAVANSIAGTPHAGGHITINCCGVRYLAHRLAWLHYYGEWPEIGKVIDHINGKSNAISNLRVVGQKINMQNRATAQINNKLGFLGVDKIGKKFRARIKYPDGKQKTLGIFLSPEEAHEEYKKAKAQIFLES